MADISLKIKSDFAQAEADFKSLIGTSEKLQKVNDVNSKEYKALSNQIDKYIEKNKLSTVAMTATQGKSAALANEYKKLQTQMQTLIEKGLDPMSPALEKLRTRMTEIQGSAPKVQSSFSGMLSSLGALGVGFGTYQVANKLISIGSAAIQASAAMEQSRVAFTTMLGSAESSQQLLTQIQEFAASTPFQFNELVDASKRMIAFGFSAEEVTQKLGMIGDVSAGLGQPIGDMIYLFGQVKTQGRAMTQDLNQFANRGVPIFDEVAKAMGVTKDQVKKLAEEGKITYDVIEKAFQNMTGAGGKFGGLMEAQSATLAGKWSNFNDGLDKTLVLLGDKLAPMAKNSLSVMSMMVSSLNKMLEENSKIENSTAHYTSFLESNLKLMDGTVDKLKYMSEAGGVQSKEAALYLGYLSGSVQLNNKQIQQLEERLKLNRSINDIAYEANKNELESWRQRGLVVAAAKEKTAEKSPKGGGAGTKKSEEQIFQDSLNVMQNMELLHYENRQKMAEDFFTKKMELEKVDITNMEEWQAQQVALIAENTKLSFEQKMQAMDALSDASKKRSETDMKGFVGGASLMLKTTGDLFSAVQTIMENTGHKSKALIITMRALAAAQAIINAYLAASEVRKNPYLTLLYPANEIAAGITLSTGLAQAAAIATTPISGQTGLTSYEVPDIRQNRNDGAPVRAQAGETVSITPRGESAIGTTNVSIKIGEAELFSIVQKGINTGEISVTNNNIGRGVFAN